MEFIPNRLLLGLRVANSVMGITPNLEPESESESEEEMYSMLSISMGIVPRTWKDAARRGGDVDASGRSGTVHTAILKLPSEKKILLSGSVIYQGRCCNIKYSQPVVAYIPAPMLNSAREKLSFSYWP
jgi:hypothetical protein